LEYNSDSGPVKNRLDADIEQHAKFTNDNFNLCEMIKYNTIKHGHMFTKGEEMTERMYKELEGFNML
jgi:acylphosphatase